MNEMYDLNPNISVVVCAYNEGTNIERCLSSLSHQNSNVNYEVIVIDDGTNSKDFSIKLMDQYSEKYQNIKVIHKQNGGSISARMAGIKKSKGNYITFVDADDYVSSDYIKIINKIVNNNDADLYQLNNKINKKGENLFEDEKDFLIDGGQVSVSQMYEWTLTGKAGAVWDKIYRRTLFSKINSSIFFGEDVFINANYLKNVSSIIMFDQAVYYHISDSSTSGSITNKSYKKFYDIDNLYKFVAELEENHLITEKVFEEFIQVYLSNVAHGAGDLYRLGVKKQEIASVLNKLSIITNWLYVINSNNLKKKICIWCLKEKQYALMAFIDKVARN